MQGPGCVCSRLKMKEESDEELKEKEEKELKEIADFPDEDA